MGGARKCLGSADLAIYRKRLQSFFKSVSVKVPKSNRLKKLILFHVSHMGFVKKTACKLSVSNGNANALSTYKMKNIFLLMGVGRWASGPRLAGFWNLTFSITFLAKKVVFLVLRRKNEISPLLALPLERSLWLLLEKCANGLPPCKNPSDTHVPNYGRSDFCYVTQPVC